MATLNLAPPLHPTLCLLPAMPRELLHLFLLHNSLGLRSNPHGNTLASVHAGMALKHLALNLLCFRWLYVPKSLRPLKKLFPKGLALLPITGNGLGSAQAKDGISLTRKRSYLAPGVSASWNDGLF